MHLIIADDDGDSADILAQLLRLALPGPLTITVAVDGRQALAAAMAQVPDVVIMDLEMPQMNGFDAAAAIRSALGRDAPLLIAVSGHVDRAHVARTSTVFDHALVKPIDPGKLIALLRALRNG